MKKIRIVALLLLSGILFSCYRPPVSKEEADAYVNNLTEDEIVHKNRYSKLGSTQKTVNNKTTCSVKRFTGVEKLFVIQPENKPIEIHLSCQLTEGALRIAVCDNEKILCEFDPNQDNQIYLLQEDAEKIFIKTAGKDAAFKLEINCVRPNDTPKSPSPRKSTETSTFDSYIL